MRCGRLLLVTVASLVALVVALVVAWLALPADSFETASFVIYNLWLGFYYVVHGRTLFAGSRRCRLGRGARS